MKHKACQVGQVLRNAIVAGGATTNPPVHPLSNRSVDGLLKAVAAVNVVEYVIGKMPAVATVQKQSYRVEGLASGC